MTRPGAGLKFNPQWNPALWFAALLAAGLAACAPGQATLDAVQLAAAGAGTLEVIGTRAAERETLTATALWPTDTPTPTDTATPTLTPSPTATSTPTPTPLPSGSVLAADRLRAGPGAVYPAVVALAGGEAARPLGQTEAGDWLLIVLDAGDEGWLLAENFSLDDPAGDLPIVSDIPSTPTLPPVTFTPTVPPPTATSTPSPYTCDFTVNHDPGGDRYSVVLIGQNWPLSSPVTLVVSVTFGGATKVSNLHNTFGTGDADDQIPGGFWVKMSIFSFTGPDMMVPGVVPATYTIGTWACSRTVTGP